MAVNRVPVLKRCRALGLEPSYLKETGGFPASVLGSIAGVKEVEPFA